MDVVRDASLWHGCGNMAAPAMLHGLLWRQMVLRSSHPFHVVLKSLLTEAIGEHGMESCTRMEIEAKQSKARHSRAKQSIAQQRQEQRRAKQIKAMYGIVRQSKTTQNKRNDSSFA